MLHNPMHIDTIHATANAPLTETAHNANAHMDNEDTRQTIPNNNTNTTNNTTNDIDDTTAATNDAATAPQAAGGQHVDLCVCWHPLMWACSNSTCTAVDNILVQGDVRTRGDFDVNERGPNDLRALHYAVRSGSRCAPHIARLLLERGALVDARDCDGFTPLMTNAIWAADESVALTVARLLVERGACTALAMCDGRTAAQFAEERQLHRLSAYLRGAAAHGPDMRRRVRGAVTALAKGRVVLALRGERGPLFGRLTHWLDYDLVAALAGDARLSFAQCQLLVDWIRAGRTFESRRDIALAVFGDLYSNIDFESDDFE